MLCHHGREQIQRIGKENWEGDSSTGKQVHPEFRNTCATVGTGSSFPFCKSFPPSYLPCCFPKPGSDRTLEQQLAVSDRGNLSPADLEAFFYYYYYYFFEVPAQ